MSWALIEVRGTQCFCGRCGELVYPDALAIRDHFFEMLPDGRARWTAFGMDVIVHECTVETGIVAQAEQITLESSR